MKDYEVNFLDLYGGKVSQPSHSLYMHIVPLYDHHCTQEHR